MKSSVSDEVLEMFRAAVEAHNENERRLAAAFGEPVDPAALMLPPTRYELEQLQAERGKA